MTIKFANSITKECILVMGEKSFVSGANRDVLSFIFPVETSLDEVDTLFSESACESITLIDEQSAVLPGTQSESVFKGYTVRVECARRPVVTANSNIESEEIAEQRVVVKMAQRTYGESKLAQLSADNEDIQNALIELAEIITEG